MNIRTTFHRACVMLATSLLAACGAGSSDAPLPSATTPSTPVSTPSGGGTTVVPSDANGVISAFGSVFVNGREYDVNAATRVLDGDADDAIANASALRVGMMVSLTAGNAGAASQLRFTSAVRGEVDAINTGASTLTVLGQTVVVSSGTSFAGTKTSGGVSTAVTGLANLSVGDYVVVYGYLDCTSSSSTTSCTSANTRLLASLVLETTATGLYRTTGYAQNVNAAAKTFTVGGLTVAYATTGTTPTACTPSPCAFTAGDFVEVRGTAAPVAAGGTLTLAASRIRVTSTVPVVVTGQTTSIAGPVANLNMGASSFTIRGVSIDGSGQASTVATLAAGQIVLVTGTVNANGSLKATAITVEQQATLSLSAPLTAQSSSAATLTVLGRSLTANSNTRFADLAHNVQPFNLSNFTSVLAVGDQLEVSGYNTAAGLVATRVVRLPTPAAPFVAAQGVVTATSVANNTLVVGGVQVTLNAATSLRYPGPGTTPTVAGFLGAIAVNSSVVSVRGAVGASASSITATTASLMDAGCSWAAGGL